MSLWDEIHFTSNVQQCCKIILILRCIAMVVPCVSSVYRNFINPSQLLYIIYISDRTAITFNSCGTAKKIFNVIKYKHNIQNKSFDLDTNQQLLPLCLQQTVLFITRAILCNLPTAAGNTWLNQESNDAQNVPLCGNTQSLERKAEYARSGEMEPRTDICAVMRWHEQAWHKQKKIFIFPWRF